MQFQTHSFPPDPTSYIAPTWQQLQELAFAVSRKLLDQNLQFDRLVTLAKGGWPMSRSLVDYLSIPEVASVGVKFYSGINSLLAEPEVYQDLPVEVQGERVLLFDDVADSGESLIFTQNYLRDRGVAQVTTATLFYKPKSRVKPDAFGAQTSSWILFPFEVVEMTSLLRSKWEEAGASEMEITDRLTQLGFDPTQIQYFFPK